MPAKELRRRIDRLRQQLGSGPLSAAVINQTAGPMFRGTGSTPHWGGVHDQRGYARVAKKPRAVYIINTSHSPNSRGVHWVAIYISPAGVDHVYDSFGRDVDKLLPYTGLSPRRVEVNRDGDQHSDSALCGHYCLAWLELIRDQGIMAANRATANS